MRVAVNAFALIGAALTLQAPLAAMAEEQDTGSERRKQDGEDQWVPSLAIVSGLTVQDWDGDVESEICPDCTFPSPQAEALRPFDKGDDRDVTPYVGGSVELMTPALPIPMSPRLFIGGEFLSAFGTDRDVAGEGDPKSPLESPLPPGADNTPYGEDSVIGQGSVTSAEIDKFVYGAHAGIAFPVEIYGRALRIKPMFAWIRYDVDVSGKVVDAECLENIFGTTQCNENLASGFLRNSPDGIVLRDDESDTFDGIGPGVDVEMDTGRFGPLGTSLFAGARLYKILGNRKIKLSDTASYDDVIGQDETRARWSYEVDDWIYRIGIGIRFQWLGTPGPDLED
jgi:hypothetical protein